MSPSPSRDPRGIRRRGHMPLAGQGYAFASLAEVMGKANDEKSGDRLERLAGAAAARAGDRLRRRRPAAARERAAAKAVLAGVPLRTFVEEPLLPPETDELSRAFLDALDRGVYARLAGWTVGELREHLLADLPESLATLRPGLLPEMAAAVVKVMSNPDLMLAAGELAGGGP